MKGMGNDNIEDFDLVERVLGGCEVALDVVRRAYQDEVEKFLRRSGASPVEAVEIALQMLADCAMGTRAREPLFRKYRGHSPLLAWLKTVALNVLIDRRRREKRMVSLDTEHGEAITRDQVTGAHAHANNREEPLLALMKNALLKAISSQRGSEVVMLYLRHIHGVTQRELADTWGWHESKVSRVLDSALKAIAGETLKQVKRLDPWLDLQWNDFLELAGSAEFSIFEKPQP